MAVPLDAIRAFHNAFRKDVAIIDGIANAAARQQGSLDELLKRYNFFNEILVWHAVGEEKFVFPAMEKVAPLVSEPYERDHRGLDSLFDQLKKAVDVNDLIEITRTTAAFRFHLDIHLDKEDTHLYRIFNDRMKIQEQGTIASKMAQEIPQQRYPEIVAWLVQLIGMNDRENIIRIWQQSLPAPAFTAVLGLVKQNVGNDWDELVSRIPELNSILKV